MSTRLTHIISLSLIALTTSIGIVLYPTLPDQIATHWNVEGVADGYGSKMWGVFISPLLMLGMYVLYIFIPKIDPLRANFSSFQKQYSLFFVGLQVFFAYVFVLTMLWNIGYRFPFSTALIPALAGLLWLIGSLITHAKRNWFVGIRTPWTLSSDDVWGKTHTLGGALFRVAAIVCVMGLFLESATAFKVFIGCILVVSIVPIVYSYYLYRQKNQTGRR